MCENPGNSLFVLSFFSMNKNFNKSTCAVCFEVKGEHSKTLNKITKGLNICVDFELRDSKLNWEYKQTE